MLGKHNGTVSFSLQNYKKTFKRIHESGKENLIAKRFFGCGFFVFLFGVFCLGLFFLFFLVGVGKGGIEGFFVCFRLKLAA